MASTLISTLYPPMVDTFMPAFISTKAASVYFSLSPYNNIEKINYLHVTVVDQKSNESVLQSSDLSQINGNAGYALQVAQVVDDVLIIPFNSNYIGKDSETDLYGIQIPTSYLKQLEEEESSKFKINQYYKVQLRFDSTPTKNLTGALSTDYLIENRQYFSEWSSVCLIRPISEPLLVLNRFDNEDVPVSFNQGSIPISGSLYFEDDNDLELMQSYQFKMIDKNNTVFYDTGIIYPITGSNSINCIIHADDALQNTEYDLAATIVTKNQYTLKKNFKIKIANFDGQYTFEPKFTTQENTEDGIIKLNIKTTKSTGKSYMAGKLYIKRASSIDNFKTWELISCTTEISSGSIDRTINDTTVGSLIRYVYSAQFQYIAENASTGTWSILHKTEEIYPTFYDILLSRGDTQLAIRYNGKISSLSPIATRTKFTTLGSKYPKFAENAQVNYKQYTISGMITAEGDFNRKFISELSDSYAGDMKAYKKVYGDTYMVRNDSVADGEQKVVLPNTLHDAYPHENWFWEREFRNQVISWLNDGEVKLFRSMPEGNMAVMVTDISLTPNQSVGRLFYSFNATIHEVGDGYSLETLNDLGIITIPGLEDSKTVNIDDMFDDMSDQSQIVVSGKRTILRQVYVDQPGEDVFDSTRKEIANRYQGVLNDLAPNVDSMRFSNIQIQFLTRPKYYQEVDGKLIEFNFPNNINDTNGINDTNSIPDNLLYGYSLMYCLDSDVYNTTNYLLVNEHGYYRFPSDQKFQSIKLDDDAIALITFVVEYEEGTLVVDTPTETYINQRVFGQVSGIFLPNDYLAPKIRNKYDFEYYALTDEKVKYLVSKQYFDEIENISLDVSPYAVCDILYKNASEFTRIQIGRSGVYHLSNDYIISNIAFAGRKFFLNQEVAYSELDPWEYRVAEENEVLGHRNTLYKEGLYVNGKYYSFDSTLGIASMPVEGYVNYMGNVIRSEYQ